MTSGGHAASGPLRDPNALRRGKERSDDLTHLPAAGRPGPAPAWPLTRPSPRELVHWTREWARPQAVVWERMDLAVEVAAYVRTLALFERPKSPIALGTLLKQQQENLGLSLPGLSRRGWVIDSDSPAPKVTKADDPDRASAKARFQAIEGGIV